MRDLFILAIHLLVTAAKLLRPGGVRAVAAESLLLKHQLLISNRSRHRAPNLTNLDRFVLGLATLFVSPRRPSIATLGGSIVEVCSRPRSPLDDEFATDTFGQPQFRGRNFSDSSAALRTPRCRRMDAARRSGRQSIRIIGRLSKDATQVSARVATRSRSPLIAGSVTAARTSRPCLGHHPRRAIPSPPSDHGQSDPAPVSRTSECW